MAMKGVRMTRTRRFAGRLELLLSAVLALCVWVAATALATRPAMKLLIDVTPQAQFSVGEETAKLFAQLVERDAKVRIDTFLQRPPIPQNEWEERLIAIQGRVHELIRDLLVRYAELGGDHVRIQHFDLLRDVAASRQRIEELGGLRLDDVIVVSVGKRHRELQIIADMTELDIPSSRPSPMAASRQALPSLKLFKGEEAISSAIRSLLVEGSPKLYFLSGYQEADIESAVGDSYSGLMHALTGEGFQIARWNLESEGRLPDDAAVIGLIEPHAAMSARSVDLLHGWLRNGGRMFVNVAWSNVDAESRRGTLDELGAKLGFEFSRDLVCHLVPDPAVAGSPGVDGEAAKVVTLAPSAGHRATRPLAERQRFPRMSHVREVRARDGGPDLSFEPILQTGRWGWLAPFDPRSGDADYTAPRTEPEFGPRAAAAVIDVKPQSGDRAGALILVGGIAFINHVFEQNADLALNLFDWLARRDELVTVRGNRYVAKKLTLVPQQLERAHTLLLRWAPGVIFALGLVVLFVRRRR